MIVAELALEKKERHDEASKEVKMPHQWSGQLFASRKIKSFNHQNSNFRHLYIASILTKLLFIYDAMVWAVITTRFRNGVASIYVQEAKERDAISDRPFLECPTGLYGTQRERFSRDQMTQQVIYDATLWKDMAAGSKISDTPTARWRDTANATQRETPNGTLRERFFGQTATIYVQEGKKREVTGDRCALPMPTVRRRDTAFFECPTGLWLYGTLRERSIHDAITQQPQSIYDATEWRSITPGFKNQTQKSRSIYDTMVWAVMLMGDGIALHLILSMTGRHRGRYFIYDTMS